MGLITRLVSGINPVDTDCWILHVVDCVHATNLHASNWLYTTNNVESSPSTTIINIARALDSSWTLGSLHSTGEGLFSKEILWKVKLAGLASSDSSGELNPRNSFKLTVSVLILMPFVTFTRQKRSLPELLLQMNVTSLPSGTTYPPGRAIREALAERMTVKGRGTLM